MNSLSFIPLGGVGSVTKNMYLYEVGGQMLIVDCGLGFPDETMLGVDLLLPDISYIKSAKKKIVGMLLTHGHDDHIGALPFIIPALPPFPIFATPLTASFANERLKEFGVKRTVLKVDFNSEKNAGIFNFQFIRVTHSIPDTSHIFIKTPVGNFYHGSDFKFDDTPYDRKMTDFQKIKEVGNLGVLALMSDCLGAERQGRTGSEFPLTENFDREIRNCHGKFIVTTYSSHISRINQVIEVSEKYGRKVCFVGRSLIRAKETALNLGYLRLREGNEIQLRDLKKYNDRSLTLIVAGTQGQEESALSRIASGEHRDIKLKSSDTVIISASPIPGNEIPVYELINTIARRDARVLYSDVTADFHVSGHGAADELSDLIKLVKPRKLVPIGGEFRHMVAYRNLALKLGFRRDDVILGDQGVEIVFNKDKTKFGRKISSKNVYVDEISGEEMEGLVLMDRQRLSEGGVIIILVRIGSDNGQLIENPDIIIRGVSLPDKKLNSKLTQDLKKALSKRSGRVTEWFHIRKLIGEVSERRIFRETRARPLVLPVVIEV